MQQTGNLQFAVLGPLEVRYGGKQVPVRGRREHAVLGMLLLADGGMVTIDRLIEAVWDDMPPYGAVKSVRNCVSALRRRLAEAGGPGVPIETSEAGYQLLLEDCRLDAREFRQHSDSARLLAAAGRIVRAIDGLRTALGLWRGPALAGIGARIIQAGVVQLEEQRMATLEECLDLELVLGRHRHAISELQALTRDYPLRERIAAQLMLALYRSGRQAEALDTYHRLARTLTSELGIEPAGQITRLHEAILRHESGLDLDPGWASATRTRPPAPRKHPVQQGALGKQMYSSADQTSDQVAASWIAKRDPVPDAFAGHAAS